MEGCSQYGYGYVKVAPHIEHSPTNFCFVVQMYRASD